MRETQQVTDAFAIALDMSRDLGKDNSGIVGYGIVELIHEDGSVEATPFANLVTDYGDLYYAQMAIALVGPAAPAQPTKATGMQVGTGTAAVAKNSTGSSMGTFISGAGVAFDSTYPQTNNLGAGLGVEAVYKSTFPAGTGTGTIQEATITNGTVTTASTTGNTIARILTGATIKGSGDVLAITWRHKWLGA